MGRRSRRRSSSDDSISPRKHRKHDRHRSRRSRSSSRHRRSSSGSRGRKERSSSSSKSRAEAQVAHSSRRTEVTKIKTEPLSDLEGVQGCSSSHRVPDRQRHQRNNVKEEVLSDGEAKRRYERFSDFKDYRKHEAILKIDSSLRPRRSPVHWGRRDVKEEEPPPPVEKEKPNFEITGALAADTNTYKGVVIKYSEPSEARKPKLRWSLYPFKGDTALPIYEIHRQSAYLFGRDRNIADIPVDHPSCSKQHAVFQYRSVPVELEDGTTVFHVKPYLIDLGSANGTYLNNERMEPQRYYELFEKDVFRFGYSTREYVLLNEKSVDNVDDEQKDE
ncbi:FHA domain protein [Trichuris suis]|nr:FHA domain protein [Trichuris suis]